MVVLCASCAKDPRYGIDTSKLKGVSHGTCKRHAIEFMREGGLPDSTIQAFVQKFAGQPDTEDLSNSKNLEQKKKEIEQTLGYQMFDPMVERKTGKK